ncbi:hypothetical protein BH11PSE13_BH11PSE13_06890 [soil metagenome]
MHRELHHGMVRSIALPLGAHGGCSVCLSSGAEQNETARRLYAALGFEDFYSYHYRVPAATRRRACD